MNRLLIFITIFLLSALSAMAQAGHVEVHVAEAGTLAQLLEGKTGITSLTVSGNLNDADATVIHDVCNNAIVSEVDLRHAHFPDYRLPSGIFAFKRPVNDHYDFLWLGPDKIVLPKDLKIIGTKAIFECGVSEIVMWDNLEEIEERGLSQTLITELKFPVKCCRFGQYVLARNDVLTYLEIPEGTTLIPNGFAADCMRLNRLILPSSVATIRENAFCHSGTQSIFIPEGVKRIEKEALFSWDREYIVLPSSIEFLGVRSLADLIGPAYCKATTVPECEVMYHEDLAGYGEGAYETPFDRGVYGPLFSSQKVESDEIPLPERILYVPFGTAEAYAACKGFRIFTKIIETDNFPASLDELLSDSKDGPTVTVDGRTVTLGVADGRTAAYQVYSLDGRTVAAGTASADVSLELPGAGVYVVRAGAKTVKIAVR